MRVVKSQIAEALYNRLVKVIKGQDAKRILQTIHSGFLISDASRGVP
jgi:hypothetical protein